MKKNINGFSLPELLVSISISMILMLGIGVFVTSGLKNITLQKKILDNSTNFSKIYTELSDLFLGSFDFLDSGSNEFLTKNSYLYGEGNFSILSVRSFTGYCDDFINNDYLVKKSFTPFEGIGGDMFDGGLIYDYGGISVNYFTNTIKKGSSTYSGFFKNITGVFVDGTIMYLSDSSLQGVYTFDLTDFSKDPVLFAGRGGGVYGNELNSGSDSLDVYLNNPTGISIVGTDIFISDSGNNRIIYVDSGLAYEFMGEKEGLNNPTGIFYDEVNEDFYISNTGFGEIWKISLSESAPSGNTSFSYFLNTPANGVNNLGVSFNGGQVNGSYSSGSFQLQNNTNFVSIGTGELVDTKTFSLDFPIKAFTLTGTLSVDGFGFTGSPGQYYINYDFDGKKTIQYSGFIIGDGNLLTKNDNLIEKYEGFSYPTGFYKNGSTVYVNDFIDRKSYSRNKSVHSILNGFDFDSFVYDKSNYLIKSFDFLNNSGFLNLKIEYYQNYDCIDPMKNVSKTIIYKKKI